MTNRTECLIARAMTDTGTVNLYSEAGDVVAVFNDEDAFKLVMGLSIKDYNNRSMAAYAGAMDSADLARNNID